MHELVLRGLDAANPLGFLAALGSLRVLTLAADDRPPQLAWQKQEGAWRPCLLVTPSLTEEQWSKSLSDACRQVKSDAVLALGDDLNVSPETYRAYSRAAADSAGRGDLTHAGYAACFASELLTTESGAVQDTALRTMSGAGHQHFLKTMRNVIAETSVAHIHKALFSMWRYDDPVRNMTLRWDPEDDNRYALRWCDPSGDPQRQRSGAMWGANRLAIEGLPLMPVMPTARQLDTTGFRTGGSRATYWTWPIWETPVALDTVRSLVALKELQDEPPDRATLRARGVVEIFRSQRLTVGKFRNFTWGVPP